MQSMPLLLRQSLRSSVSLARTSSSTSHPGGLTQFPPTAAVPKALYYCYYGESTRRNFSICRQCQFRKNRTLLLYEADKDRLLKDEKGLKDSESGLGSGSGSATPVSEGIPKPEDLNGNSQRTFYVAGDGGITEGIPPRSEGADGQSQQQRASFSSSAPGEESGKEEEKIIKDDANVNADGTLLGGRLPSYLESHRSQFSKQFSSLMDNLQSNIFVAGQRLNDLTGYSSIEALKKEIQEQEARVRDSRTRVREAKDAYAAAINRRSTSQREVNELLQRKHAWSHMDLERFTSLYRNDHTNEVAESEAQAALAAAEQEAEEAAAQLSKSILSRYHEEQVWSDKIRRMSTWGTWGLMGVNVLLFLIFQVAVEPWRRRRLVTGFEEKVMEALEREKALMVREVPAKETETTTTTSAVTVPTAPVPEEEPIILIDSVPFISEELESTDSDNIITPEPESPKTIPTTEVSTTTADAITTTDTTTETTTPTPAPTTDNKIFNLLESCKSQLSRMRHPPALETSLDYLQDRFSDQTIVVSKRDITNVAIQSAAAGAAIMGLVIALVRPW